MDARVEDLISRVQATRSPMWLDVLAAAQLNEPAIADPEASRVVEPYLWLLDRIGEGLPLTQAGYLRPAMVMEAMTKLGFTEAWSGKGNREEHAWPARKLRETARDFGLVRSYRGELVPTKLGRQLASDPIELWWRIAERLPLDREEVAVDAGLLALLRIAAGLPRDDHQLVQGLALLGWVNADTGKGLDDHDAAMFARNVGFVFRLLGVTLVRHWRDPDPDPTPSARALARAVLIGRDGRIAPGLAANPFSSGQPRIRLD